MLAIMLQIDEAAELASGVNWTLASFAIFVWLVTLGAAWWIIRGKNKAIEELALENRQVAKDRADDLSKQLAARGKDVERMEGGLQTIAAATQAQQQEFRELRSEIRVALGRMGG